MQVIPVQPVPSQLVKTVVAGQNCQIFLHQEGDQLYFDLNVNGTDIVTCVLCEDANPLVCIQYEGFQGNFLFNDTQGNSDPQPDGLGERYQFVYLTVAENAVV